MFLAKAKIDIFTFVILRKQNLPNTYPTAFLHEHDSLTSSVFDDIQVTIRIEYLLLIFRELKTETKAINIDFRSS